MLSSVEARGLDFGIHALRASPRETCSYNPLAVIINSIWDLSMPGENLSGASEYPLEVGFGIF